ncbi:MAG: hypothetical protein DMF06_04980 [Verrucomicrobia bacterium]|jgi:DNA-binding transcriptional regulator YiaG|nr:MAG: hypothetical protein DMF06_04980 [Verrucomicrobiota bacterium]
MNLLTPEQVREARAALGMTQQQLADALLLDSKYSRDTVRNWENGNRRCPGPESVAIQLMLKVHRPKKAKAA